MTRILVSILLQYCVAANFAWAEDCANCEVGARNTNTSLNKLADATLDNASDSLPDKIRAFQTFWEPNLAPQCTKLSVSTIATVANNDKSVPDAARNLYLRLKLSGGVVSWKTETTCNVVLLDEIARHEAVTPNAVDFMLCHELGHFMSPAPTEISDPLPQELLADRWGLRECLPRYWKSSPDDKMKTDAAFKSGMKYYEYFLKNLALGAGKSDFTFMRCRKVAGEAAIQNKKPPRCVGEHFGKKFAKLLLNK